MMAYFIECMMIRPSAWDSKPRIGDYLILPPCQVYENLMHSNNDADTFYEVPSSKP